LHKKYTYINEDTDNNMSVYMSDLSSVRVHNSPLSSNEELSVCVNEKGSEVLYEDVAVLSVCDFVRLYHALYFLLKNDEHFKYDFPNFLGCFMIMALI
jgi:hypothetical protein